MAQTEAEGTLSNASSIVAYAASILPVGQGGLALIVITFVGQVWPDIDPGKRLDAFFLIYASGAHFMFSFLIAGPATLWVAKSRSSALQAGFTAGLIAYIFWSLNVQHRGLANLLLASDWSIPLPFGDTFVRLSETLLGGAAPALFFSPLLASYIAAVVFSIFFAFFLPDRRR